MRVSPGLTRGTKGGGGQTVNMASPLLDIIYDISYILLYYISYNVKTHQFSTFFFFLSSQNQVPFSLSLAKTAFKYNMYSMYIMYCLLVCN